MSQLGFLLDLDRCTGCAACIIACTNENRPSAGVAWRGIVTFNELRHPAAPVFHLSLACNHCLEPACLSGCPAGAYSKDPATGAVVLDAGRCMGCRYCAWVCPYDSPRFSHRSGLMEKCGFCDHRLAEGLDPACVAACPVAALGIEASPEPQAVRRAGFPEVGLRPAIRVVGNRRDAPPLSSAAPHPVAAAPAPRPLRWEALRAEWSLWLFTAVTTLLVAWWTAAAAAGAPIHVGAFAALALAALAASALHLGRPSRAWRGLANLRRSWISREALLVLLFIASAVFVDGAGGGASGLRWAVALVGFSALLAMDLVYRVPGQQPPAVPHSAMATLAAAYYLGLLLALPAVALPVAAVKTVLYLVRRRRFATWGAVLGAFRVLAGLLLPTSLLLLGMGSPWLWAALALAGELIDRAEFYAGLEFLTPAVQARRDLASWLRGPARTSNSI